MLNKALKSFQDAGDYDAAVQEWEARPIGSQTWANPKLHQQDAVRARAMEHTSAHNVMEEYTASIEELIKNLTDKHTKQIKALIKTNTEAMAQLMATLKSAPAAAGALSAATVSALSTTKTTAQAENIRHG